jgi:hypothetical protein
MRVMAALRRHHRTLLLEHRLTNGNHLTQFRQVGCRQEIEVIRRLWRPSWPLLLVCKRKPSSTSFLNHMKSCTTNNAHCQ